MAQFKFTLTSINGRTIVGGSILAAYFLVENGPLKTRTYKGISASRIGKGDRAVRSQPVPEYWRARNLLSALTEQALADLRAMWNETEGAVYLRITDGNGTVWRTTVMVEDTEPVIGVIGYDVVLFVPDPTWEEDTLQTTGADDLNQTTSPVALGVAGVITNNGNRPTEPTILFSADAAKSPNSASNDFPYSMRTFFVNRAPKPLRDEPVYLCDVSGAASRLVSDSAAGGLVVRQTGGATTLTADPGAGGTTIAVADTTAFNTNGGLAIIQWVTGSVFGTMEAVYYTTKSVGAGAGNLTGCTRGVGGTTAQAHAAASAIAASATMPNGDDVRVWYDDTPNYERFLVAWNSGASDIEISVTCPAAVKLTPINAMTTVGIGGAGQVLYFAEGNGQLAADGFIVWQDEVFRYISKVGATGIQLGGRSQWGTTAATHAVTNPVYANPHRIVVGFGWAKADTAPAPSARRPAIDLVASSNQVQRWGDQASDPLTVYADRANPGRPKSWSAGFDYDGNTVGTLMSVPPDANGAVPGNVLAFKSDVPGDSSLQANYFSIPIPQGIKKADVNAFKNDWAPSAEELNLELFTRDPSTGNWKLQDQLQQSAAAAARALPSALVATAYEAKLKARYNIAAGARGSDATILGTISNASDGYTIDGANAIGFVLDGASPVTKLRIRLALVGAGSQVIRCQLVRDSSHAPSGNQSDRIMDGGAYLDLTVNSVTPTFYDITVNRGQFAAAGTYWLLMKKVAPFAGINVNVYGVARGYEKVWHEIYTAANGGYAFMGDNAPWFYVQNTYDASGNALVNNDQPVFDSATGLRTGTTASLDKTIITLEPLQTVYVHRNGGPVTNGGTGAMYHLLETIANATTGESVSVDKWMQIGSTTLTIDFENKTVVYSEGGVLYNLSRLLSASFKLSLNPGNNTVTATDPSRIAPGQIDFTTTWRGKRTG